MKINRINYKGVMALFGIWLAVSYAFCMSFGVLVEPVWAPFWSLAFPSYLGLPGFDLTVIGLIAGFIWALIYGAIGGAIFSAVYNIVVARFAPIEISE